MMANVHMIKFLVSNQFLHNTSFTDVFVVAYYTMCELNGQSKSLKH